ncbi:Holliday junction DNA helicase RuvA [Candidatus Kaiserbacteria bacterium RIFCSPLOWO2_12_FULL_52_8]|uniref:Holliday junction branch migration complex subunit RuvA n=1 Tax=Candidatus Kaiserbacteria bacterium RIFCSPHIGHO2_01_FULL_53_31 TaxID=1798481 RepID=A0A1F6CHA9_9BACT|nr:MAG: Holliday junction DNA helicase RuvA [Candidatus Kaiserbacteria bacterium RIFCSPHIGHO2_01_FULL_53_31]OGG92585.1 MAG: Holliday junction DNA helicase RuvA [Candidatus Kaiserbacteria bacterium RIFCSPLOWO2_12_FULL_52_8]
MIRQVRGKVVSIGPTSAIVEVAGLGIKVHMSSPQSLSEGREACLATHLAVKQDGMDLYGFPDALDRDFFELILSVSGVGPKTAQSVLRRAPREALEGAISARDLTYLTKVVGIGKKIAEKMLVELADKVGPRAHESQDGEVFDTLVALGYTEREARKALQNIPDSAVGKDVRLKAALSSGQ